MTRCFVCDEWFPQSSWAWVIVSGSLVGSLRARCYYLTYVIEQARKTFLTLWPSVSGTLSTLTYCTVKALGLKSSQTIWNQALVMFCVLLWRLLLRGEISVKCMLMHLPSRLCICYLLKQDSVLFLKCQVWQQLTPKYMDDLESLWPPDDKLFLFHGVGP